MGEKIMDGFPSREEALADFFAAWEPARSVEYVALDDAVGRVLACDLASTNTLPVVRASSFDGIAVKSAALAWITCAPTPETTSPTRSTPW